MTSDSEILESVIPPGLICAPLMTSEGSKPLCHYEDWVRELINNSPAFMAKTGGESFRAPTSESHGEADAISDSYEIDFKLILGQSRQHALRETSFQHVVLGPVTLTLASKSADNRRALRLHIALRGLSAEQLREISDMPKQTIQEDIEKRDIWAFLHTLHCPKNLLLIYPCLFFRKDEVVPPLNEIISMLTKEYCPSLSLRKAWQPEKDTFLAFFRHGKMEILESTGSELSLFDEIAVTSSKTFTNVAERYSPIDYFPLGDLLGTERIGELID